MQSIDITVARETINPGGDFNQWEPVVFLDKPLRDAGITWDQVDHYESISDDPALPTVTYRVFYS